MNLGIFGGSFDPIHVAHVYIAECFVSQCNLNKCLFIPSGVSPFKSNSTDAMFNDMQRLELIKNAIAKNDEFEICDYEIQKGGISYTIDTVTFIKNKYAEAKLFLLIGTDQANKFDKWKDYWNILEMVTVAIVRRENHTGIYEQNIINSVFAPYTPIWLEHNIMPISSTSIRKKIRDEM